MIDLKALLALVQDGTWTVDDTAKMLEAGMLAEQSQYGTESQRQLTAFANIVNQAIGYRGGSGPDEDQIKLFDTVLHALLDASGVTWRVAPLGEIAPEYASHFDGAGEMLMTVVDRKAVSYDRWGWVGNNLDTQADELDQGTLMQAWMWLTYKETK